jgi:hypothetical protein
MKLNKTIVTGITLFTLFTQPIYLHALENSINNRTINIQEVQKTKLNKVEALSNEEINNLTSSIEYSIYANYVIITDTDLNKTIIIDNNTEKEIPITEYNNIVKNHSMNSISLGNYKINEILNLQDNDLSKFYKICKSFLNKKMDRKIIFEAESISDTNLKNISKYLILLVSKQGKNMYDDINPFMMHSSLASKFIDSIYEHNYKTQEDKLKYYNEILKTGKIYNKIDALIANYILNYMDINDIKLKDNVKNEINRFIKNLIDNNLGIKIANKIIEYVDSSYNTDIFILFL